ncbi:hypothetical protein SAMN02745181_0296 [Rubritalea squalenifaciens DSM 18772]|uniref:Uncharacterized protein n=2 Tax=Rubritalea TaxID=361050 RepID=A0A1M6BS82_9BACT|nr:hypothetical protein [Rubritalea squalenifaciens]SHI51592.1 hypothetical protein SAMN02745181_0296 [Rubritalea squalenifaciens DSM 18772]
MATSPFIHIHSRKFPIQPEEADESVNEGIYGKALADYLAEQLRTRGYQVPFTCGEDWGWWVEILGQPYSLGCCVYGASDADENPELCVKISRDPERKWSILKFRMIDTHARVGKLQEDLKAIFTADPDVKMIGLSEEFPLWQ